MKAQHRNALEDVEHRHQHPLGDAVLGGPTRQKVVFEFKPAPRSGEDVAKLTGVHKGYGSKTIYAGLDFLVRRRERWCVLGVNGAGKSTLLKLVTGAAPPDRGVVTVGASAKVGFFAQHSM